MSDNTPIAIVGIGCRFPGGATGPEGYWSLLEACGDGVSDVPADRWSADFWDPDVRTPGRSYTMRAGYLEDPGRAFDAAFFGISPREAETLDPQQRLLLEVGYEALEDAGMPLERVRGSSTGVFVGGFTLDNMLLRFADLNAVDAHTATSSSMTVLSNRLSYAFDLRGPSITLDTACSSSLVATHLACRALRAGDCDVALAGGVNVMLLPNFQVVMCKGRFLAPDGRSKAFDAAADGYGRGEGAGVVVLKPLDRALADGDRIYAVLRGTGVNQDGTTDGMPQPSGSAQATLFRTVCEQAGIDPAEVGYIEAHGTGTALGDPIEVGALGSVYGRPGDPTAPRLGSVKPNIGHLEAAAGIAGLIKAALSVHHARIVPHWRPGKVNPALALDDAGLVLADSLEPWDGARLAVVNSFGYGGTNAHAVLEQAPEGSGPHGDRVRAIPLSGSGDDGLRARARQISDLLGSGAELAPLAGALAHRRSHLPTRAVVVARDAAEAVDALEAVAEGRPHAAVIGSEAPSAGVAWLFTGMGPQWWAMGAELYECEPAFRRGLDAACDALALHGCAVRSELFADRASSRMPRNDVAQPANFALQVGLTTVLREQGLEPDVIIGHSTGEMAAAWAAGALDLHDAARVVAARARLQQEVAGGGMLAIAQGAAELEPALDRIGGLEIAAFNADDSVTVAGAVPALEALQAELDASGTWCARVRVQVAYHSAHMDPIRARLGAALADLQPRAPSRPLISTVTGEAVDGPVHDAAYWWRNTRGAVRLADAVRTAVGRGIDTVVEIGPHPVLASSVQAVAGSRVATLCCLGRQQPEAATLLRAVGSLYVRGRDPDPGVFADDAMADLPSYPWQRRDLWREPAALAERRLGRPDAHPLLRERDGDGWCVRIDTSSLRWLRDHVVRGAAILPGAATLEAARAAVAEATGEDQVVLSGVALDRAVGLADLGTAQWLRAEVQGHQVRVQSRIEGDAWALNATATVEESRRWRMPTDLDLDALRARITQAVDVDELYAHLATRGLQYGPAFRGLTHLWRTDGEVLACVDADVAPSGGFVLPPSTLDCAFQALLATVGDGRTLVPVALDRLQCTGPLPRQLLVWGRVRSDDGTAIVGDLVLADAEGRAVARVVGLRCQELARPAARDGWWHDTAWIEAPAAGRRDDERVVWRAHETADPIGGDLLAALLEQVRACVADGSGLDVCTRGAFDIEGVGGDPAQAAVWGLARVARTEHPALALRLLDLDPRGDDEAAVHAALDAADDEEEMAVRGASRLVARLRCRPPVDPAVDLETRAVPAGSVVATLEVARPGELDSLVFAPATRTDPGAGEVEIEIEAAALNFKDVMKAMGLLDEVALEATYLGWDLGMEAVGRVVRTGSDVELEVGQRVLVYKGGTLRSHVVADARFVVPCPESWSAADASSFFVTATAWHALVDVARLKAGETVLVHSAAGGVGLAAVGIARSLGARVVATAGTEAKRDFLRGIGVEHVLDSRTLDFGDDARDLTDGRGVDVVLNSLGGRAIDVGLACLAPGGRFVELGKRDLAEGRPIGLGAFNRRTAFLAVDLDRAASERPEDFPILAQTVLEALIAGRLAPLPADVYAADQVVEAFRALASGAQIGKVVVQLRQGTLALADALGRSFSPSPGRPWLVTGGLGGFGLATAAWLADQGVTHLVLASRRGEAHGSEASVVASLRARGVRVDEVALDVADPMAVTALVDTLPDLAGVVHAAALLDDGPLIGLAPAALDRTLDAKARGGWNLHTATATRALEAFVLYSSISARVGNPGQGGYAAANMALEGLAAHRRSLGLPATAVAWGVLDEVGMVARDTATHAHLRSVGLTAMPPRSALDAMGRALAEGRSQVALVDIDWTTWARAHAEVPWHRLSELVDASRDAADQGPASLEEALEALTAAAAPVFGLAPSDLDAARPLRDLGLDSLMAVELAASLGRACGVEVSAMDLLGGRSLVALARRWMGDAAAPAAPAVPTARQLRERILLTAPYDRLEGVRVDGDTVHAEVEPDVLAADLGPIAAAEAGRHLAILGSLAAVLHNPSAERHEYAVASADLVLDDVEGGPAERVRLHARCVSFDRAGSSAEAEGELFDLDGRRLATIRVRYHVLPVTTLWSLFPEHRRASIAPSADPYRAWSPAPVVRASGAVVVTGRERVPTSDCAGHFPGLPALPVSILGREVFAAVTEAVRRDAGDPDARVVVRGAQLETHRWVWAEADLELTARPDGRCEVRTEGELAATFQLQCAVMRASAHHRASREPRHDDCAASLVADAVQRVA